MLTMMRLKGEGSSDSEMYLTGVGNFLWAFVSSKFVRTRKVVKTTARWEWES